MKTKKIILSNILLSSLILGCNSGGTQTSNMLQNRNIAPKVEYSHIVSPNGPDASLEELEKIKNQNSGNTIKSGIDTFSSVRCYYSKYSKQDIDTTITNPSTEYVWAENSNGSYYKLYGYWNTDGISAWKNMFFTSTKLSDIQQICNDTISRKSNKKITHSFYQVASDNNYSFNYTIWQNSNDNETNTDIDKIIAFGDSLTDTNNIYNASGWLMPNRNSWFQGRFTNGYTWVEYLSKDLKIPSYNWAVGGSEGSIKYLILPGINDQIQSWLNYMISAKNYDVKKTLFTILIGGNDFVNDNRNVNDVINDVKTALVTLAQHGAKNIFLMNLPDVTKSPVFHMGKNPDDIHQKVIDYNNSLITLAKEINTIFPTTNIMLFDTKSSLDKVITNPSLYGFTNTTDSCLNINTDNVLNYTTTHNPRNICTDASKFVFWDTLHPTTATHYILANEALPFLKQNIR